MDEVGSSCVQIIDGGRDATWERYWELMRELKWQVIGQRIRRDYREADAAIYGSLVRAFELTTEMQPGDLCCGGGGNWGHEWNCDRLKNAPFVPLKSTVVDVQDRSGVTGAGGGLLPDLIERGFFSEDQVSAPPPSHDDPDVKRILDYYGISGEPSTHALASWKSKTTDDYSLLKYVLHAPNPIFTEEQNIPIMFKKGADEFIGYVSGTEFANMMFGHGTSPSYKPNSSAMRRAERVVSEFLASLRNWDLW